MEESPFLSCPKCLREISPQANKCLGCGYPINLYRSFEWKSKSEINGIPFINVAFGRKKVTGKLLVAKGIIAIGQFAIGVISIAQFGIGFLFGFGQFLAGYTLLAQFALSYYFGIGQLATGITAIAQIAYGKYVLAQIGFGEFVWSMARKDPEAIEYFNALWISIKHSLNI